MKTLLIILFLSISSLSAEDIDDNNINLVTDSWEGWTNRDGSGFYFDLFRLVYSPLGYSINVQFIQ